MKNILLLTDFSDNAQNAITYAMHFFKTEKCFFYVMHVHKIGSFTSDDLMLGASGKNIYESIISEPRTKLNLLVNKLKQQYKNENHKFDLLIDFDDFTDAINQTINAKQIDLIVLGTNGKTGAREIIFGSNTLNVIRKVKCTTLVIPENQTFHPLQEILLPLGPFDLLNDKSVLQLQKLVKTYKLNLNVLRINPNKCDEQLTLNDQSYLIHLKHRYYVVNDVPINYAMQSFVQTNKVDMVLLFVHQEKFFDRVFKGNSATKISAKLKVPLIIFHND